MFRLFFNTIKIFSVTKINKLATAPVISKMKAGYVSPIPILNALKEFADVIHSGFLGCQ